VACSDDCYDYFQENPTRPTVPEMLTRAENHFRDQPASIPACCRDVLVDQRPSERERDAKDLLGQASFGITEKHYIMAQSRLAGRALAHVVGCQIRKLFWFDYAPRHKWRGRTLDAPG